MLLKSLFLSAAMAFIALVPAAQAQQPAPVAFSDEQVNKILQLALDSLPRALCEGNKPCAPASAEERALPLVSLVDARAVMMRGILSGAAVRCGLDWQRLNFVPMMTYWRRTQKKSERQMAAIGLVHGIMQGISNPRPDTAPCTDEQRRNLAARLAFAP
jgi:hypothetical protein